MLKNPYKVITQDNGEIKIYGNNHWKELEYKIPEWADDQYQVEECFTYKGRVYFLSEFMNIHNKIHQPNPPEWMLEFDGYMSDSFFSGILIKLSPCGEGIKVFTYIS